ncbi:MAG: TetR/AcrR family transcriptional regulator [Ilumatobacteraceae bacterium]
MAPRTPAASPAPSAPSLVEPNEDGRHARRDRNRLAVVDAMLELYAEGNLDPSSDEIAERAGLSPRSLFRYFEDLDDLVRVAIGRQHERTLPAVRLDVAVDAPLADRVARLVAQRQRLFGRISSVGIVSRVRAPFQPLIASELAIARSYLRRQIEQLFAPELAALGKVGGAQALAAIDVLTSFESVHLLQDDQQLSAAEIEATLAGSITRLLEA